MDFTIGDKPPLIPITHGAKMSLWATTEVLLFTILDPSLLVSPIFSHSPGGKVDNECHKSSLTKISYTCDSFRKTHLAMIWLSLQFIFIILWQGTLASWSSKIWKCIPEDIWNTPLLAWFHFEDISPNWVKIRVRYSF